jgi:hypothetical protein
MTLITQLVSDESSGGGGDMKEAKVEIEAHEAEIYDKHGQTFLTAGAVELTPLPAQRFDIISRLGVLTNPTMLNLTDQEFAVAKDILDTFCTR